MSALQRWFTQQGFSSSDEISSDGLSWTELGDITDPLSFFESSLMEDENDQVESSSWAEGGTPNDQIQRVLMPITLGLLDGETRVGHIDSFSAHAFHVHFSEKGTGSDPMANAEQIQTQDIAYIAFDRLSDDPAEVPEIPDPTELNIHLKGGETIGVVVSAITVSAPTGFFGYPLDPVDEKFRYHFFQHGIQLKEGTKLIGELLVEDGLILDDDVDRCVNIQSVSRQTSEEAAVGQADSTKSVSEQSIHGYLGNLLIAEGLITVEESDEAIAEQERQQSKRVGEILIEMGVLEEEDLYRALAEKFHMPFVDLDETPINQNAVTEIDFKILRKYCAIPIDSDDRSILVAISDPLAADIYDVLRFHVAKDVTEVLAIPSQIQQYLESYVAVSFDGESWANLLGDIQAEDLIQDDSEDDSFDESDNVIVRMANQIIIDAYSQGVSDVHIEPDGKRRETIIRFRIDGICGVYQRIPAPYWRPLVARLKILARLDISERRRPQDGKIVLTRAKRRIELRIATIPTVNENEVVVMRILASSKPMALDAMGLSTRNLEEFRTIVTKPYGLVLVVGPTGSGKTTSLHSALGYINTEECKIWTAEDPVEITQAGLCQVQMKPKIGLTFASAMRAFLRADPDIIMIGEMRDQETASIAVEASLTGHLVLSTLHTNTAAETITRLLDMGLEPFSFADALLGVLAQRLARMLCPKCRYSYASSEDEFDEMVMLYGGETAWRLKYPEKTSHEKLRLWRANGCEVCSKSGYKGRLAIHELLVSDSAIRSAVEKRRTVTEIRDLSVSNGMTTLLQDGIEKAVLGFTDIRQVLAVCS